MNQKIALPAFVFVILTLLTGCNAVTGEAKRTIEYLLEQSPEANLTPEEIEAFPYTALYMNMENASQSLVVLGYVDGDNFSWVSGENETVVTRHGRIIRTIGLHANLRGVSNVANDPLVCVVTDPERCPTEWEREHDFELRDGQQISRAVHSRFERGERASLTLPGGVVTATLVREHVHVAMSNRDYVNEFWVEDDGHIVKSRQMVLFDEPRFSLTQVKWVGR